MKIPDAYPDKLNDKEIQKIITHVNNIAVKATKDSTYSLGPSYAISMANLGINELNKRNQERLIIELGKQRLNNKKTQGYNKVLSILTITLAVITILIGSFSLKFAASDKESDLIWQQEQIEQLIKSNENLESLINTTSLEQTDTLR